MIGAFGTVTKGLGKGLDDLEVGGCVETNLTTVLLGMARILKRVLETLETCCHSNSSEKQSANADEKISKGWHHQASANERQNSKIIPQEN